MRTAMSKSLTLCLLMGLQIKEMDKLTSLVYIIKV